MKTVSLMLVVLFLFSSLCLAGKGGYASNNNYGRAITKTSHGGIKTTTTHYSKSGPTSITKEVHKTYPDGSSKHIYTRGDGSTQTINHKK